MPKSVIFIGKKQVKEVIITIIIMLIILILGCLHGYNKGEKSRRQYENDRFIKDKLVNDIINL